MARRRRKNPFWPWIVASVVVVAGVSVFLIMSGDGDGEPSEEALPPNVGVESDVRFQVISGGCGYEVVVTATATVDPEMGEFCLVRLDVRNTGDEPRSFDASCQYLMDASGGRYGQREDVLPLDEVTTEFFEQELPPQTLTHDVGLYYDVPKGTQAEAIELHTACDSPGVSIPIEA